MKWQHLTRRNALTYTAAPLLALSVSLLVVVMLGPGAQPGFSSAVGLLGLLCGAVGFAVVIFQLVSSRREQSTMRQVTEGARRMAEGELDQRVVSSTSADSSDLVDEFNRMSQVVDARVRNLDTERRQMAVAIDTIGDGVIVIDSETTIAVISRSAEWLLGINAQTAQGRPLAQVVRDPEVLRLAAAAAGTRQRQIETTRREFVSNVSHELRSPLASASAMVEILESGAIDERETALDFVRRIRGDITRMTSLVDELLELSSLESGQMPLHLAPVNIHDVLEEIVERFSLSASSKGVELIFNPRHGLPHVMGEQRRLEQVLTNLVENALRFTPNGGKITLKAQRETDWVIVTVTDTGVGIPREHLPHVFERFYKVDRSRREQGTGLGLAISKHLVEAQGGDISATSVEGEGSEFRVRLRRAT